MPRVGDEQDDTPNAKVTLFAADSALQRLDIVDPGFSFDHHLHTGPIYNAICTSSIALEGDADLGSPPEARRQPFPESAQQGDMRGIAYWIAVRMEARAELQPEDRRQLRRQLDGELVRLATLDSPDLAVRQSDMATELSLTDASGASRRE